MTQTLKVLTRLAVSSYAICALAQQLSRRPVVVHSGSVGLTEAWQQRIAADFKAKGIGTPFRGANTAGYRACNRPP